MDQEYFVKAQRYQLGYINFLAERLQALFLIKNSQTEILVILVFTNAT